MLHKGINEVDYDTWKRCTSRRRSKMSVGDMVVADDSDHCGIFGLYLVVGIVTEIDDCFVTIDYSNGDTFNQCRKYIRNVRKLKKNEYV